MADDSQLEYEDGQTESQPEQAQRQTQAQQPATQSASSELPIKEGAVVGSIAVIATYLSHLLFTIIATADSTPAGDTEMVGVATAGGWSYLSALGTGFEAEGEPATLGDAPNHAAAFATSPFTLSTTVLALLTLGGALAAGYGIAKYTGTDNAVDAVKASATVVPPYLVFALLAAFLLTHTYSDELVVSFVGTETSSGSVAGLDAEQFFNSDGEVTSDLEFGPATTGAVLYAGLLIPAVLAVIGGLVTQWEDALETVMAKVTQ
ncbi:hypothetical protein [Natronolimnohabitans innermongolicus]|uniref:DUF7978 domain-containing protein n=1 Tax=Natronolimnohabitans innermongolicus JCM 12255 TaxID=1227499 RepID=L9X1Q6_9EURY|nr:hypothetical protein [Natronolimnohabitans innermongolicus]ELY55527.1 hypothetical protein C493_11207 [Natronolimnohabitans innermongolicus JCM 12255]